MWCVECPDEPAEQVAEAGGSPVNEQPGWHAADCPWRLANEVLEPGRTSHGRRRWRS
jgi:hypothetical protein